MLEKRLLLALTLFATILTVTACTIARGSGDVIRETWEISNFDSIDLSGSGKVVVTQNGRESLTIETDDNVMKRIKVEVDGRTLKLGFKPGVNIITPTRLIFHVSVDDLVSLNVSGSGDAESASIESGRLHLDVSGSGNVRIVELQANELNADISGSGTIELAGDVAVQNVSISGAGKYHADDLCSASVRVDVSGSGDATVCATGILNADVSGSGSIRYYGQPTVHFSGSGSGSVNHLGDK